MQCGSICFTCVEIIAFFQRIVTFKVLQESAQQRHAVRIAWHSWSRVLNRNARETHSLPSYQTNDLRSGIIKTENFVFVEAYMSCISEPSNSLSVGMMARKARIGAWVSGSELVKEERTKD